MVNINETLANGFIGLLISIAGTYVIATWKGAKSLDAGLTNQIAERNITVQELQSKILQLSLTPKISTQEAATINHLKQVLDQFADDEKSFLKWLAIVGPTHPNYFRASQISTATCNDAIGKARQNGLIEDDQAYGGIILKSRIKPGLEESLLAILAQP